MGIIDNSQDPKGSKVMTIPELAAREQDYASSRRR